MGHQHRHDPPPSDRRLDRVEMVGDRRPRVDHRHVTRADHIGIGPVLCHWRRIRSAEGIEVAFPLRVARVSFGHGLAPLWRPTRLFASLAAPQLLHARRPDRHPADPHSATRRSGDVPATPLRGRHDPDDRQSRRGHRGPTRQAGARLAFRGRMGRPACRDAHPHLGPLRAGHAGAAYPRFSRPSLRRHGHDAQGRGDRFCRRDGNALRPKRRVGQEPASAPRPDGGDRAADDGRIDPLHARTDPSHPPPRPRRRSLRSRSGASLSSVGRHRGSRGRDRVPRHARADRAPYRAAHASAFGREPRSAHAADADEARTLHDGRRRSGFTPPGCRGDGAYHRHVPRLRPRERHRSGASPSRFSN